MPEFHAPYNFIPVTGKVNGKPKTDYKEIKKGVSTSSARHDLWLLGTYSGKIICRLHLDTPTVVGGKQVEDKGFQSKRVIPYQRNGQPAIPGSSLRGMIGSIAEALSQSALRVLKDRVYSVRKPVGRGLSAIGMLKKSSDPNRRANIVPLTIPTLRAENGRYQLDTKWLKVFKNGESPLNKCLPAYVDGYEAQEDNDETRLTYITGSFLDTKRPESFRATANPIYYYARLKAVPNQPIKQLLSINSSGLREKIDKYGNYFLLGQERDSILTEQEWQALSEPERKLYTKGILRVLGIDGREQEIPPTKKHELFIPLSNHGQLPVPDEVIHHFQALAEEQHGASKGKLPFALKGYPDWTPRYGQLFFFDVDLDSDDQPYVSEISISAIWRKRVVGSTWDFFQVIDPDLLPWNPKRKKLTPAELLFGVVMEGKPEDEKIAPALASRLRFADALPLPSSTIRIWNHVITLKILSSPKPPSPAMYFHPTNGNQGVFVKKTDLSKDRHRPNGRKVYLHHPQARLVPDANSKYPWETKDDSPKTAEQKLRCTPLQDKQDFFFHIDFDNLTKVELTLLLTSLRPSDSFRHRLGLGKSLGLGTMCVDIESVFFINRHKRYGRGALSEPRYHSAWRRQSLPVKLDWGPLYSEEANRLMELSQTGALAMGDLTKTEFYSGDWIDSDTLGLLNTVGDPAKLRSNIPVHTPLDQ